MKLYKTPASPGGGSYVAFAQTWVLERIERMAKLKEKVKSDVPPFAVNQEDQVKKLIAGPDGAYICDECIEICAEIMDEELD